MYLYLSKIYFIILQLVKQTWDPETFQVLMPISSPHTMEPRHLPVSALSQAPAERCGKSSLATPEKNRRKEPKHHPIEKEIHLNRSYIFGFHSNFPGCIPKRNNEQENPKHESAH